LKSFGKILDFLIAFAAINIIPRLSSFFTDLIFPYIQNLDPDKAFLWISIHHVFQIALTIVAMKLYFRSKLSDWGFKFNYVKLSLKISLIFLIGAVIIQNIFTINGLITGDLASRVFDFPLTSRNIAGYYAFQGLLSGTCEEPLFRGFVITVLAQSWKGKIRIGKIEISVATIIAAIFFSYAHIGFSLFPFEITRFFPVQIALSFAFGILYGVVFEKTKSLFGPILLHNISNINYSYIVYLLINLWA